MTPRYWQLKAALRRSDAALCRLHATASALPERRALYERLAVEHDEMAKECERIARSIGGTTRFARETA